MPSALPATGALKGSWIDFERPQRRAPYHNSFTSLKVTADNVRDRPGGPRQMENRERQFNCLARRATPQAQLRALPLRRDLLATLNLPSRCMSWTACPTCGGNARARVGTRRKFSRPCGFLEVVGQVLGPQLDRPVRDRVEGGPPWWRRGPGAVACASSIMTQPAFAILPQSK